MIPKKYIYFFEFVYNMLLFFRNLAYGLLTNSVAIHKQNRYKEDIEIKRINIFIL